MFYFAELGIFQHILLCLIVFLCLRMYFSTKKRKYNLPPGPRGLPIVGILPFLGHDPHVELYKLGKKYGGIFSVNLGMKPVVVVTDVMIAKQVLNKISAADRPPDLFQHFPGGVGFAEFNGSLWNEQRRYTIMEMKNLGFGRSNWEKLVQAEVSEFLDLLAKSEGHPLVINRLLAASISNNVLSLVTNNRLPTGHPRRDILDHGVESFQILHNQTKLIVHFPKLFKYAVALGLYKVGHRLKDIENMNQCVRQEIEELKENRGGGSYIDKYLAEIEKNEKLNLGNTFTEANLIGNVQALIIAGSDTTYISLIYLFLAMASFPEIQEKVHKELDNILGKDGSIDWVDRQKLPYCFATILEGQRWRTVAPLSLLHRANEDFTINGYDIPKDTNIMTVLWAFNNDTKYWKDPDVFQPERFLSDDAKNVKEPEAFIPFSSGKRICPGKTVAYIELFNYFVSIMQRFQVLPASESTKLDLEGIAGLTLQPKAQPLRFVSR